MGVADLDLVVAARSTVNARLAQLVSEFGRAEPALLASKAFLDRLDTAVQDVLSAEDATGLDAAAHQLAGSAETLGAMGLGAAAREVMRHARECPDMPLPAPLGDGLRAEADAARTALELELAAFTD